MADATMIFPPDFRWGTATSAYQVEGNNTNSDWWAFEQEEGAILEGQTSGLASDWWQNAEKDLDMAAEMGTNAHRLSIEWSRIEPEPSVFDTAVLDRYREILQAMHNRGIEPMVTLHHFSNPQWLVEKGDFNAPIVVEYFQRYVKKVVGVLGDLVPKWITINEPMVYVFLRYFAKAFPRPSRAGLRSGMKAVQMLLRCHAVAYHEIKALHPGAEVGFAKNMALLQPKRDGHFFDTRWTNYLSWVFNEMWLQSVANGRSYFPAGRGKIDHLAGTFDFIGVNYYTRFFAKFPPFGGFIQTDWPPDAIVSDGNYGEVYPEGIFKVIKQVLPYKKPIYITENGLPDVEDKLRPSFILTHLREVWRAISFCFPVMGYYHWSLVDNFEWDRGWTQRFGLIELDMETQVRKLRRSGRLYGEICRSGSINSNMAAWYTPDLLKTIFRGEAPEQTSSE
ncbi:MAG: family 1 glycosylhydrolase [Chloroflexi bacterium]|nr:family 1 glycosylhydrolase [Chloroflexota bacterium]